MIRHLAGIAEIVDDLDAAVAFYREKLGLKVEHTPGQGYAQVSIAGVPHFGIWLRTTAANAMFGDAGATDRVPLGFTVGLEVDGVGEAEDRLRSTGAAVLQGSQVEPWGQRTARFLSTSGALCEVSETPDARRLAQNVVVKPAPPS